VDDDEGKRSMKDEAGHRKLIQLRFAVISQLRVSSRVTGSWIWTDDFTNTYLDHQDKYYSGLSKMVA
jgi:hypothetical protein